MSMQFSGSIQIGDQVRINKCISDPEFMFLVSFPRTGSHWLRSLMELYFKRPSLVRVFYYPEATEFTCLHHHDLDLQLERRKVIYLYRNPVHTIFSQLKYHKQDHRSRTSIEYWTDLYGKHLFKWLVEEQFTTSKFVLRYEDMVSSIDLVFQNLTRFMEVEYDKPRLIRVSNRVTKYEIQRTTRHDLQVIDLSHAYSDEKVAFCSDFTEFILGRLLNKSPSLEPYLKYRDAT